MPRTKNIVLHFDKFYNNTTDDVDRDNKELPKLSDCFEYVYDDGENVIGIKCDYNAVKSRYLLFSIKEKVIRQIIGLYMNSIAACFLLEKSQAYFAFKDLVKQLI